MPHDSPGTQVFWCQRSRRNSNGITPYGGAKRRWGRLTLQCETAIYYPVDLRIQTYTEPVPFKYGKIAKKYPWIYRHFYSVSLLVFLSIIVRQYWLREISSPNDEWSWTVIRAIEPKIKACHVMSCHVTTLLRDGWLQWQTTSFLLSLSLSLSLFLAASQFRWVRYDKKYCLPSIRLVLGLSVSLFAFVSFVIIAASWLYAASLQADLLAKILRTVFRCKLLRWVRLFVCLSVCPLAYDISETSRSNFASLCAYYMYLSPWLDSLLAALHCVMYFRFCGWRYFSN